MDEKINQIKEILNNLSCTEAMFILGSVEADIQSYERDNKIPLIFKI